MEKLIVAAIAALIFVVSIPDAAQAHLWRRGWAAPYYSYNYAVPYVYSYPYPYSAYSYAPVPNYAPPYGYYNQGYGYYGPHISIQVGPSW